MSRVIVLGGAPGSGKTTLAGPLRQHLGGPWVNMGKLGSFHLKPDWSDRGPAEEAMRFENLVFILNNYVRHGYTNILVDDLRDYRVVQMPEALSGAAVRALTLTVRDDDTLRQRIVSRGSGWQDVEAALAWNRHVIERPAVTGETKIETAGRTPDEVLAAAIEALSREPA